MTESSTLLYLPQLVNLSLNCKEGIIHFQALHTLLQVVIQQTAISDVAVEFRGKDSERIQALLSTVDSSASPSQFTEYSITGPRKRKHSKRTVSLQDIKGTYKVDKSEKIDKLETAREKELRVIERRKNSKEDPDLNPPPLQSPPASTSRLKDTEDQAAQTVVLVDSQSQFPQFSVAVSKDAFDGLFEDVLQIKEELKELKELPGNMGLIEATRTQGSPILDMFQILTLTKRTEAAEEAVGKLSSLVEDLVKTGSKSAGAVQIERIEEIRKSVDSSSNGKKRTSIKSNIVDDLSSLERRVDDLEKVVSILKRHRKSKDSLKGGEKEGEETGKGEEVNEGKEETVEQTEREGETAVTEDDKDQPKKQKKGSGSSGEYKSALEGLNLSEMPPSEALVLIQEEFDNIKSWIDSSLKDLDKLKTIPTGGVGGADIDTIESKLADCTNQMQELDSVYNNQIGLLNQQLGGLQREVNGVLAKIDVILPGGDSTAINAETMMELSNKLLLLEKEIIAVSDRATQLQADKVECEKSIEAILEQIDVLKIVKANREDLEDALGDKADACQINRKVSHDQFDAACDDLSRGIEEALNKLQEQEEMWRNTLDTIQRDIGNKLDKNEVDPLRDFVNNKLKALQEKFKSLAALKREQEAAGTKSKLLRDVNCISCDKEVVMRKEMDSSLKPKAYAMPPPRNMAPYLAYELDQLRKQQKCVPGSKNLNFLESALKSKPSKDKDHLCNRYCGGSHTVTTPQQRVSRLGHFLEQWGPEIAPMHDDYIRGKDGQMYKARDDAAIASKISKSEPPLMAKSSQKSEGGSELTEEKPSQPEKDAYISASAEKMLSRETTEKTNGEEDNKKNHSIGSAVQTIQSKVSTSRDKVQKAPSGSLSQQKVPSGDLRRQTSAKDVKPEVEAEQKTSHGSKRIEFLD